MKRSEMILNIASELVHEYTNLMPFDKAKELADIVLTRIEREGMYPPATRESQWVWSPEETDKSQAW